jgi:low temperature requirement protein LtrA
MSNLYYYGMALYLRCCTSAYDFLLYYTTSQRSPVTSDQWSNHQVSPLPFILVEILGVCVQVVSVLSMLILMSEGHLELAVLIVMIIE